MNSVRLIDARNPYKGFTLVELLVTSVILSLLMMGMLRMVNETSNIWGKTRGKINQYQEGRKAFESMTRRISEAVLNPYYDYVDASGVSRNAFNIATFIPARYERSSELRFLSGPGDRIGIPGAVNRPTHTLFFQAPSGYTLSNDKKGMPNLLNTFGYFIEYGSDEGLVPSKLGASFARQRFRLMEMIEPSESLELYAHTSGVANYVGRDWFTVPVAEPSNILPVAENVIALIFLPRLPVADMGIQYHMGSLAPLYLYDSTERRSDPVLDSKNRLPPLLDVTMVFLDEAAAKRLTPAENAALLVLLVTLFRDPGDVQNPDIDGYAKDLETLRSHLDRNKIEHTVLTGNVTLKGAK